LEEEEAKLVILQKAIKEGIDSGIVRDFNATKHLLKLKAARKKNGK
jgi:hypothetical protein